MKHVRALTLLTTLCCASLDGVGPDDTAAGR